MRRVTLALAGSGIGVLMLIGLRATEGPVSAPTGGLVGAGSEEAVGPGGTPIPIASGRATLPAGSYTVTGPSVATPFGPVQVKVTVANAKIAAVAELVAPADRGHSSELTSFSAPLLQREVLDAQSANIHVVSGATYTSDAYAQSLQAALDNAAAGKHD